MTEQEARYLSIKDLSVLLQVPVATIYRWRHIGRGPRGIRCGRHVRFSPGEVQRWLEQQADPAR